MWSSEFQHLREACGCPEVTQVEIECVQAGGQLEKLGNNFGSLLGVVYSKSNGWLGHATGNPRVVSVYPYPLRVRVLGRRVRVPTGTAQYGSGRCELAQWVQRCGKDLHTALQRRKHHNDGRECSSFE